MNDYPEEIFCSIWIYEKQQEYGEPIQKKIDEHKDWTFIFLEGWWQKTRWVRIMTQLWTDADIAFVAGAKLISVLFLCSVLVGVAATAAADWRAEECGL